MNAKQFLQTNLFCGIIFFFMFVSSHKVQAIEPVTVTTVAATAVVLTAIGGLSVWIDDQSNDVAVAVLASSFGKHGITKNEDKDTAWSFASVSEVADDAHGSAFASALANESIFGAWAGVDTSVLASTLTMPLHILPDDHSAKGFASASVDGKVKATTKQNNLGKSLTVPNDPSVNNGSHCNGSHSVSGTCTTYVGWDYTPSSGAEGDVFLTVAIPTHDFLLELDQAVGVEGTVNLVWEYSVQIDGVDKFFTSTLFDETGVFSVSSLDGVAGLNESIFSVNEIDNLIALMLTPNSIINGSDYYVTDILLDRLALPNLVGTLGEEIEYDILVRSSINTSASIFSVPVPATVWLFCSGLIGLIGMRKKLP